MPCRIRSSSIYPVNLSRLKVLPLDVVGLGLCLNDPTLPAYQYLVFAFINPLKIMIHPEKKKHDVSWYIQNILLNRVEIQIIGNPKKKSLKLPAAPFSRLPFDALCDSPWMPSSTRAKTVGHRRCPWEGVMTPLNYRWDISKWMVSPSIQV